MKLLSFSVNGEERYGMIENQRVTDLKKYFPHCLTLKDFLAILKHVDIKSLKRLPADLLANELSYLPVITNPNRIICAGLNYYKKEELRDKAKNQPTLFIRFADSQTGHLGNLLKPHVTEQFDYEGELAVIIGLGGRHISEQDAINHIAGYSCYMDGSVRDWQGTSFTSGKNWPKTAGFGPYLVTADEDINHDELIITTRLNGHIVQQDTTSNMIHRIASLISFISTFCELHTGDVIVTGTPDGIGKARTPPIYLNRGDKIEVDIQNVGCLTNFVISDKD